MKVIYKKSCLFVIYSLLVILCNSQLMPALANASFNCKQKGLSPVEKMICESPFISSYDRLLHDMYSLILEKLPINEKENLKKEQKKWLKEDRFQAFKVEEEFGKKEGYANTLAHSYGRRIKELCVKYSSMLKEALYSHLETTHKQKYLTKSIQEMFFAAYFYDVFSEVKEEEEEGESSRLRTYLSSNKQEHLLRQPDGTWLLVWNGTGYFQVTNRDGGCYSFKLIHPKERRIEIVEIEEKDNYRNLIIKTDYIQGYVFKITNNTIVLASGGLIPNEDGSPSGPRTLMTYSLERQPPLMKLIKYEDL